MNAVGKKNTVQQAQVAWMLADRGMITTSSLHDSVYRPQLAYTSLSKEYASMALSFVGKNHDNESESSDHMQLFNPLNDRTAWNASTTIVNRSILPINEFGNAWNTPIFMHPPIVSNTHREDLSSNGMDFAINGSIGSLLLEDYVLSIADKLNNPFSSNGIPIIDTILRDTYDAADHTDEGFYCDDDSESDRIQYKHRGNERFHDGVPIDGLIGTNNYRFGYYDDEYDDKDNESNNEYKSDDRVCTDKSYHRQDNDDDSANNDDDNDAIRDYSRLNMDDGDIIDGCYETDQNLHENIVLGPASRYKKNGSVLHTQASNQSLGDTDTNTVTTETQNYITIDVEDFFNVEKNQVLYEITDDEDDNTNILLRHDEKYSVDLCASCQPCLTPDHPVKISRRLHSMWLYTGYAHDFVMIFIQKHLSEITNKLLSYRCDPVVWPYSINIMMGMCEAKQVFIDRDPGPLWVRLSGGPFSDYAGSNVFPTHFTQSYFCNK